jgi:hypothetical protein
MFVQGIQQAVREALKMCVSVHVVCSQRRKKVYPEEEEDRYKAKRIDGLTQCQFRCLSPHAVIVFQWVSLEDLASHCLDRTQDLVFGRKSEKSAGAREEDSWDLLVSDCLSFGGEVAAIVVVYADCCSHLGAYHGEQPGRCHFRGGQVHGLTGFAGCFLLADALMLCGHACGDAEEVRWRWGKSFSMHANIPPAFRPAC